MIDSFLRYFYRNVFSVSQNLTVTFRDVTGDLRVHVKSQHRRRRGCRPIVRFLLSGAIGSVSVAVVESLVVVEVSFTSEMAIKMDVEGAVVSEELDISQPLVHREDNGESKKTLSNNHGESIFVVLLSTLVAVLGSLEFGFCVGFSSPAESSMIEDLGLTLSQYSTFGSLLTIGAMIGAITSGRVADYLGRKGALRVSCAFCLVGWLIIAFSKDPLPLDIGRLLVGCGVGVASYTVPIYIAEIAPKNFRGGLTLSNQLSITTGILVVYLLGMFLAWRTLAITGIIPSLFLAMGLFFIPESPRWLAKVGRDTDFEAALQTLRGKGCDVSCEAAEIREFVEELQGLPQARICDLFQRRHVHSLTVGIGLMVLQQFGGINAVIFYASEIFKAAGFASSHAASVGIAALQVPMTALGALFMDKSGRRPLLMVSAGGMSISCFLVGLSFYIQAHCNQASISMYAGILALIGLLGYIGTFSLGMGGIPWVIMSEIFPINLKGIAGSLVTLVAWLGSWVITITFNFLLVWSATASFFVFCGVCAFTVLFVAKLVPETKGRTLEEIQSSF